MQRNGYDFELDMPNYADAKSNNETVWQKFWQSGGAVDFSEIADKRAFEIEKTGYFVAISHKNTMYRHCSATRNGFDL